jgi:hypothetical protein
VSLLSTKLNEGIAVGARDKDVVGTTDAVDAAGTTFTG